MNFSSFRAVLAVASIALLLPLSVRAEMAAVSTRVFNHYTRTHQADGSFKPETYAFANGGCYTSFAGDMIGEMPFRQLVGTLAAPMAQRGYFSATDPSKTDLLIFVMWGTTEGTEWSLGSADGASLNQSMRGLDQFRQGIQYQQLVRSGLASGAAGPAGAGYGPESAHEALGATAESFFVQAMMEQRIRDQRDVKNAMLLGFEDKLLQAHDLSFTTWGTDYLNDLRVDRYYVIMKAYDFQLAWKEKRKKILWEARFSVARPGTNFAEVLPSMAQYAAQYFGRDSKGLIRDRLPEVKIIYGDPKLIKYEGR